jgi:uroporphyrinogen III methyltransferase/synthase
LAGTEKKISRKKNSRAGVEYRLDGRVFVITRAREQSADMTALIESYGGKVVHCPTIEIAPPESWDGLDRAIDGFEKYDWVIFTSANAVRFFLKRFKEKVPSDVVEIFSKKRVCAIGPATRRSIEESGLAVDLVAEVSVAEGVLMAIKGHLNRRDSLRGKKILIPRARLARDVLPDELSKLGAQVDAVEAYQTIKPDLDFAPIIRLFERGSVDAITFTSPSTIVNFAALVSPHSLSELLRDTLVGCIGPVTAAKARDLGLDEIVLPDNYDAQSLIEVMALKLTRQRVQ